MVEIHSLWGLEMETLRMFKSLKFADLWLVRLEYKLGYYAFMNWRDDYTMPYVNPYTT